MTKHAAEALFVVLALLGAVPLATKREIVVLLAAAAVVVAVVGLILVVNGT